MKNDDEINAAYDWLTELNNTMKPVYVTDEVIDNMANGLMDMAVMYSGDAAYVLSENKKYENLAAKHNDDSYLEKIRRVDVFDKYSFIRKNGDDIHD